jgi:hypothetical protein
VIGTRGALRPRMARFPRISARRIADRLGWEAEVRAVLRPDVTYAAAARALDVSVRTIVIWAAELGLAPGPGKRGGRRPAETRGA